MAATEPKTETKTETGPTKKLTGEFRTESLRNVRVVFENLPELKLETETHQRSKHIVEGLKALDGFLSEHDTHKELLDTLNQNQTKWVKKVIKTKPNQEVVINFDATEENKKSMIIGLNKALNFIADFADREKIKGVATLCIERLKVTKINVQPLILDDFDYQLVYDLSLNKWELHVQYYVSSMILVAYLRVLKYLEANK